MSATRVGIGQRADGRAKQIENGRQHILALDVLSLHDIFQVDLGNERAQIAHLGSVGRSGQNQRHPTVKGVAVKGVLLIAAHGCVVFREAEGMHPNLITAPTKLSQDVGGEHFGVTARYINVQIAERLQIIEGIVKSDLLSVRIIGIWHLIGHLDLIHKKIVLLSAALYSLPDMGSEFQRIAVANIPCQVKLKG